ncbi:hypothetical protein DPMN_062982 [Dreissena polymorpha]|uniref:Uncharacterized protein n=1 Tax=Dreissena polymorpha TaxID=45954 RepID=A0A9D4CAU8_DREPO|nr:hypothetical protein DPMN_062982 [Dreissena polymorpha]
MPHWMELGCNRLTDIKLVPCIGHNNNIRSMQHWIELGCNLHTDIKVVYNNNIRSMPHWRELGCNLCTDIELFPRVFTKLIFV